MTRILAITSDSDLPESRTLAGLAAKGMQLAIICSTTSPHLSFFKEHFSSVTELDFKSRIDLGSTFKLKKIIADFRPDIIHSFTARGLTAALMATLGKRMRHVAYRGTCGHLSCFDPSSWLSYMNPRVEKIICVSNAVRDYLLSIGLSARKLVTIYKGHSTDWYQAANRSALAQFGIPDGAFVIGFTGNMRPVKGADLLIEAAELLPDNAHLLMIGEVRDERILKLTEQSKSKTRIHLAGFRSDASALIGACDCFVMPSREREGLPKAVLEAMALGVPPIVSRAGGMPEMIDDGASGQIFEPGDVQGLAKCISALASNTALRTTLSQGCKAMVKGRFSLDKTIELTAEAYSVSEGAS